MSKKYREELDKIVMNQDMKKRILNNVLNKDIEIKNSTIAEVKKYNSLKKSMQIIAACFTVVVCLSSIKDHPEIFKHENNNVDNNQLIKDSDEKNEVLKSSKESESSDNNLTTNNEDNRNNNDVEKTENAKPNIDNNENYKKSGPIKKEDNESVNNNKNSSEVVNKGEIQDKLVENSNVSPKTVPETETNQNKKTADTSNTASLGDNSRVLTKSKDETTTNNSDVNNETDKQPMMSIASFMVEYKTLEEAENAVKFKINDIKVLPKGYNLNNISVISNEIIQIEYGNAKDQIIFRAGKEIDNISGDYNIYTIKNTHKVDGIDVNLEGNKKKQFNLATWEREGISYSITSENPIDEDVMLNMIRSNV